MKPRQGEIRKNLQNMIKSGAIHVFVGNTLIKFVAFFGSIFIVNVLSKDEYGTLSYVENLFHYVYLAAGLGINYGLLRYLVLAEEQAEKKAYYLFGSRFSVLFNVALTAIALGFFYFYPHPAEFARARGLLPLLLLAIPVQYFVETQITVHRSLFENRRYAQNSFIATSLFIVIKYVLARRFNVEGAASASLIAYGVLAPLIGVYVYRLYFRKPGHTPALLSGQKRELLAYSAQYMLTNSIWAIFMLNDVFLLGRLGGDSTVVANYKVAYVFPGNLSLFSSSIGIVIAPYFMKHEHDLDWVRRAYKKTFALNAAIIGAIVLILWVFAEPLIVLIYSSDYIDVVPVMRILLLASFINNGIRYMNAHLLSSMGKVRYNLIVSLLGVILQVALNLVVIPRWGATGLAYSSVLVYSLMAVALLLIFRRVYFRQPDEPVSGEPS